MVEKLLQYFALPLLLPFWVSLLGAAPVPVAGQLLPGALVPCPQMPWWVLVSGFLHCPSSSSDMTGCRFHPFSLPLPAVVGAQRTQTSLMQTEAQH